MTSSSGSEVLSGFAPSLNRSGNAIECPEQRARVKVNIAIMRAFVRLREALETNRNWRKFAELEKRVGKHDETIDAILDAIRQLMAPPEEPRREIGFHVREKASRYGARIRR